MNRKSIFKSKTALFNLAVAITGVIGFANDDIRAWLAANSAAILSTLGALNIWLRWITKGRVRLFADES